MIALMIFGIVLILGGVVLAVLGYRFTKHKLIEVEYKKSITIKECVEMLSDMGYESSQYVEMNVRLDTICPMMAPISKKTAIEYSTTIEAVYMKMVNYNKSDGTTGQKQERSEQTVFDISQDSSLYLVDSSSNIKIEVSPDFSTIDLKKVCNTQIVSRTSPWGQELIEKYRVNTNYLTEFIITEKFLPCGESAYALGDVKKEGDNYTFKKPVDKKNVCALTMGSESSFGATLRKKMKKNLFVGIGMSLFGVLVLVSAFII